MKRPQFEFVTDPNMRGDVVIDERLSGTVGLLERFSQELHFPDYFGGNWNAFFDCLCDLSWLIQSEIVIVHLSLPKLASDDMKLYLECLADAIERRAETKQPRLRVVFPADLRESVLALM
jgi:RNAse (barnase) inhibitor barstar